MIKTIARLERRQNSVNGNPTYRIHFTDGTNITTKKDSGFVYGIGSSFEGRTFDVVIDGRGSIIDLIPVCSVCQTKITEGLGNDARWRWTHAELPADRHDPVAS